MLIARILAVITVLVGIASLSISFYKKGIQEAIVNPCAQYNMEKHAVVVADKANRMVIYECGKRKR